MVQYTQAAATPSDEQYRQAIDRELTNFEERERQLMAEERRERAAKLGLVLRGIPEYPAKRADSLLAGACQHRVAIMGGRGRLLAWPRSNTTYVPELEPRISIPHKAIRP